MASDGTVKIKAELDSEKAKSAMNEFSSVAKKSLDGVKVAVTAVSAAMTAMAAYSIKVGSDFEAGMSKVSAISGATGEELDKLTDKAKEMGAKTKFSATEAASAFEYMAMAGWKTEDMLNGIEGIMNLAAASGEDLATTSDIVTDALTAFGLAASDSSHFADVLAKASSSANTNVSMMGDTFKYVAPVAGSLGFNIDDCAVAIGLMANSGIKASQAGTSLRQIFTNLVKPTDAMQGAMDKLGISLTDTNGKMKSLDTLMGDLRKSFSGLTEAEKAQYAATLAGQEGMSGFLAIVNASEEDFNSLKNSINNADGAAESMAETMNDNLKGSITILGSAVEGFGIKVYENMEEPLKDAVDTGTDCVNRLASAFDSGGLQGVVEEAGEIFNDLADEISESSDAARGIVTPLRNVGNTALNIGKTAIPTAAKAFEKLAENLDIAVPLLVSGATAIKSYSIAKTASSVISKLSKSFTASATALDLFITANGTSAVATAAATGKITLEQIAVGALTKQLGIAEAAHAAFNAVVQANPLGLALTAVAALTAGIVAYAIATDEATESTYALSESEKDHLDACEKVTDSLNEQRATREESIDAINREYGEYESLIAELQDIIDENGNVKSGYEERAKVITGILSDALGIEIDLLDGQVQKYGEVVDAIKNVIVQKKAEAAISSMQEDMANAYKNTEEAIRAYKEAAEDAAKRTNDVAEAEDALSQAQKNYQEVQANGADYTGQYSEALKKAKENLKEAKEAHEESTKALSDAKTAMENLSTEVNNYNALVDAMAEGDTAKIEEALNTLVTSYRNYTSEALATSEETRTELYNQATDYVENLGLIQDGTIKVADEIYAQMAESTAKTIENFNQLPGGIAQGIKDIGPEASQAIIYALAQADIDGKLSSEAQKGLQSFIDGFSGLDSETQEIFANAWYGALKGLEGFEQLKDPAEEGVEDFLNSLKEALDEHSPSKKTEEIFKLAMEGASNGIESGKEGLLTKAGEAVAAFLGKFTESEIGETLYNAGASIMSFFGIGVSSKTGDSQAAGKANADAANKGAGSVNPTSTGGLFGSLFGGGIGSMISVLFGKGKLLGDNANYGAGSVDPTNTGGKFGNQYASGVGSKSKDANAKGKLLGDNAKSGADSADSYSVGSDFGSGFVSGIGSWIKSAASKAAELAQSALSAAKKALDSHSPSKKAKKIGRTVPQGLGGGIEEDADIAIKASEEMSKASLDAIDTDVLSDKIKNLDVPDIMSRFYMAVDDRQERTARNVTSAVSARENAIWNNNRESDMTRISDEDLQKIEKIIARNPVVSIFNVDSHEVSKTFAIPMDKEIQKNQKFSNMLKGVR